MIHLRLQRLYFFIVIVFLFLVAGAVIYIQLVDYDQLIASVVASMRKNGLEQKLRNEIFSRQRFIFLQRAALFFLAITLFCCWLAIRYRLAIISLFSFIIASVRQCIKEVNLIFKNNSNQQNRSLIVLMIIIVIFFTFRMITSFLTYDEMWSYNYYTSNHFYYSFFTYSNYPFFEMSTHFFKWLPFPMKINLRLSPFIFGLASCILLYACLRKYFISHTTAMTGVLFFAFCPLTMQYMANARGVMYELFFAIAGIFSFLFWLKDTRKKQYLVIYFLAGVFGLYSMATHLLLLIFLLVAVFFLLRKKEKQAVSLFVKTNLLIFTGYLIIYAPILITSGVAVYKSVINTTPAYKNIVLLLPAIMRDIVMAYAGYSKISVSVFLAAIAVIVLLRNKIPANIRLVLLFVVGLPASAIFFYLATGFPLAGRSFAFGVLCIPLMACLFVQVLKPWLVTNNIWINKIIYLAIMLVLIANSYFFIPVHDDIRQVVIVSRLMISNKIKSCYDNSSPRKGFFYYYPGIEYYYRIENKSIELILSQKNSMRYKPLLPGDKYDCIVYDVNAIDSVRESFFHELYIDPSGKFKIWVRNDLK